MGLILAGGQSRRFGSAKAEARLCGIALGEWVRARLRPQVEDIVVSINGPPFAPFAGSVAIGDAIPGFRGPLAGLLSGFEWIAVHRPGVRWCVSVSVDTPFLPPDLVSRLERTAVAKGSPAIAASGGRAHPVIGAWPVAAASRLRHYLLDEGRNDAMGFAEAAGASTVVFSDEPFDPFFNINTPADIEEAERLCRRFRLARADQVP